MALINDFLSLIYPRHCQACGILLFPHEHSICRLCRLRLPKSDFHLQPDNPLTRALGGRVPLTHSLCLYLFEKSGKVQRLVHTIKYHKHKELAVLLGEMLGEEIKPHITQTEFDLLVPIPLHPKKLKERGFNQSEEFAKGLSKSLGVPIETGLLQRAKASATQTRKKKYQRWENVEGIFELVKEPAITQQHLLLVDDVVTTGATIDSAWQCLKHLDGIKVSVACIAFAKPGNF
ncbi:MAG: ComF family protein [Bacteroidia bacterium]|nr:ComF family protein [Bacteroidia bacterium]